MPHFVSKLIPIRDIPAFFGSNLELLVLSLEHTSTSVNFELFCDDPIREYYVEFGLLRLQAHHCDRFGEFKHAGTRRRLRRLISLIAGLETVDNHLDEDRLEEEVLLRDQVFVKHQYR